MAATKRDSEGGDMWFSEETFSLKPWLDFGQIENLITDYDTAYIGQVRSLVGFGKKEGH